MSYKLIVFDLDHTLLKEDGSISSASQERISRCLANNIQVTLATGRMFHSALPYAQSLGLSLPLISCQGARVTALNGDILYQQPLHNGLAKNLLTLLLPLALDVICCHDEKVYARSARPGYNSNELLPPLHHHHLPLPEDIGIISPLKVGASGSPEAIETAWQLVSKHYGDQVHVTKSSPHFLEITHQQSTKSHGVHFLAQSLGIAPTEIMAFGDSMNDLDLLLYAGYGVAVANGIAELKAIADFITASNEDDGVAMAIDQLLF